MYPVAEKVACQITFLSIESIDYMADIHHVIDMIKDSGLQYHVGTLATEIVDDKDKVFMLVKQIYMEMESRCGFSMDVKLSNLCGRDH